MPIACKYCIAMKGLKGSDISGLPKTDEKMFDHIEQEHHIPVRREGESIGDTERRFQQRNPEAGGPNCRCPACQTAIGRTLANRRTNLEADIAAELERLEKEQ